MSGDTVAFVGMPMLRIVRATQSVMKILGQPPVVVGGLAVMCRLRVAHRATTDLDVVDRRLDGPSHLEVLRRVEGAVEVMPSAVMLPTEAGAVRVDLLEVNQVEIDVPSDDAGDRLHAWAHAWAYDSATSMSVAVDVPGQARVEATTLVAESGPLAAMKLQAIVNRTKDKAGSDLLDLVRLTLDRGCRPLLVAQLAGQPMHVRKDIRSHAHDWLVRRKEWSLDRVAAAGGSDIEMNDLDLVHEILADATAP